MTVLILAFLRRGLSTRMVIGMTFGALVYLTLGLWMVASYEHKLLKVIVEVNRQSAESPRNLENSDH